MAHFKFREQDWKTYILVPVITLPLFRYLENTYGFGWAALIAGFIGLVLYLLVSRLLDSQVAFHESYLHLKNGYFGKETKLTYSKIESLTFTHDRYKSFYLISAAGKIKLPSPARLDKVEKLFNWLKFNNPALETKILK